MAIYFRLKEGKLPNFTPTAFIFGAKAAPGYARAKAIIKYINEIAKLVNNDPDVNDKLRVVFVANYNVSYAEKIMPAADISEQISTAGTEASGTGNMKFMINGAVTLGTFDGANVEIVQQAGEENNYIFGARVEEINELKNNYDPKAIYEANPEIKKVIDTLIDGRFTDGGNKTGEGSFAELRQSILEVQAGINQTTTSFLETFLIILMLSLRLMLIIRTESHLVQSASRTQLTLAHSQVTELSFNMLRNFGSLCNLKPTLVS